MSSMEIDFKQYQLRCQLRGHEDDVRGICVCGNEGIATSSRDRTVRFWSIDSSDKRKYVSSKILLGHSSFVGPLAWISRMRSLRKVGCVRWNGYYGFCLGLEVWGESAVTEGSPIARSPVESWEAHKSAIQAVIKLPSGELISGSTDTTLKLWRGMTCLHAFTGHTDTVRGLAVMHGLGILSASHDGSIMLWAQSGEVLMVMVGHTSIVYSVDSHVSGLIVSGSEDRFAKIWKVKNWTVDQGNVADPVELEAYASELSEYKLSSKIFFSPAVHLLCSDCFLDHSRVPKIGEVVDGPDDSTNRSVLDGVQYDYVFDVDIGDGEPIRKLPYNRSDNPYDTADKWLLKENLPLSYRQQIVEFILQNTGQKDFNIDPTFRDPYTGANAYVPGQPSYSSGISAKPTFKHIPKRGMLVFDAAQFDGILKKISEFNSTLLADLDTSHYHSSTFADVDIALLLKLLKSWPLAMIFPVIDILRMIVLHPDGAAVLLRHVEINGT
ncbi:4-hydroxy-3-methylbut-2-enyl diphosphate reductase [Hibiscus syriacus]|uniref:4-hydroxy-3-methylbut-2-enyl diphosphate reductase n=1 Tax=Hibiscus syriacus TaxID=106335 RepID=A0A6A3ACF4_HIBSY|nr:4-hydroxy-3-methylbut-2-enyl diphosphate reductase [Hibiscus syriacus]